MLDLSKKTSQQLNSIVKNHFDKGVAEAPLLTAAKHELARRAVDALSAKDKRSVEQELELRASCDRLGWPGDKTERQRAGITATEKQYGECHFAWVVMETFARDFGALPTGEDRAKLAEKFGLNLGNLNAEHAFWLRSRNGDLS